MAKKKPNRNTLIIGGLLVLTIIAFLLIHFFGNSGPTSTGNEQADAILEEIIELESAMLEMGLVSDQQSNALDQAERLLEEKYLEINALTDRVEELERQGTVDKSVIQRLRGQISEAKGQLLDQYKQEIDVLVIDNSRMTRLIDSVTVMVETNDSMMEAIVTENITLSQQVEECEKGPVGPAPTEKKGLYAENVTISGRPNANSAFEEGGLFPRSTLESLKVSFNLVGYGEVSSGLKSLHLVLKNGQGETVQNPGSSGTWVADGESRSFSMKIQAEYQGVAQQLSQVFNPGDSKKFNSGAHILEVYLGSDKIGEKRFFISSS